MGLSLKAGLVSKRLSFREVFVVVPERILIVIVFIDVTVESSGINERQMAAQQH